MQFGSLFAVLYVQVFSLSLHSAWSPALTTRKVLVRRSNRMALATDKFTSEEIEEAINPLGPVLVTVDNFCP